MPTKPRARRTTAVVVLLLATACSSSSDGGSSDESSAPTTTQRGIELAEWREQTTAVCEEFEPQQDAILAEHGEATSPQDVVSLFDALAPVVERYITALGAVDVPEERAGDVERTYELNELNGRAAGDIRDAAARGDQAGLAQASGVLEEQSNELIALLTDLGVPACA